jgi:hypothetical protein
MTPRVRDIQFSQILEALKPSISPQESHDKAQSIFKRSRSTRLPEPEQRDISRGLEGWFLSSKPSIFLLRVEPRAERKAKELTSEVILLLRSKSLRVVWRVSPIQWSPDLSAPSMSEMLKALVYQLLQMDPSAMSSDDELSVAKFSAMHSEMEWITLLQKLIRRVSRCYIVIETHDLFQANQDDSSWSQRYLRTLYGLADYAAQNGDAVKLLIMCYGSNKMINVEPPKGLHFVTAVLKKPAITPICRKHTVLHQKNGNRWRRCSPKI